MIRATSGGCVVLLRNINHEQTGTTELIYIYIYINRLFYSLKKAKRVTDSVIHLSQDPYYIEYKYNQLYIYIYNHTKSNNTTYTYIINIHHQHHGVTSG